MAGVGIEPTFSVLQTDANPSQLSSLFIIWEFEVAECGLIIFNPHSVLGDQTLRFSLVFDEEIFLPFGLAFGITTKQNAVKTDL